MSKVAVTTPKVPAPKNPFSLGIKANGFLFVSGQVGKDASGHIVGDFVAQVRQSMENLKAIVEAAGATLNDIVKVTIYVTDIKRTSELNAIYREYFDEPLRARATVEVSGLGLNAEIELDAIALCP